MMKMKYSLLRARRQHHPQRTVTMKITHEDMLQAVPCAGHPDTCMEGVPTQGLTASPMRAMYNICHSVSKALCNACT